jgi:hypothetical protein
MEKYGLDSPGPGCGPLTGSSEHTKRTFGFKEAMVTSSQMEKPLDFQEY